MTTFQQDLEQRIDVWATEAVAASHSDDAEQGVARRILDEADDLRDARIALAAIVARAAITDAINREQSG